MRPTQILRRLPLLVAGLLELSACAQSSELLTDKHIARIHPGLSHAADVRQLIGSPYRVDALPRLEREVWSYRLNADSVAPTNLFVQFSSDGVVRELLLLDDSQGLL